MFTLNAFGKKYLTAFLLQLPKNHQGFTLLELMIVMVVTSILVLVALPNMMSQIGKARESEAKMALSTIGLAQQTYFFEKQSFSDQLERLDMTVNNGYYSYPEPELLSPFVVKHQAVPFDAANRNIRHYSMGVYYNTDRSYTVRLCQSDNPSLEAQVADTANGGCTAGDALE